MTTASAKFEPVIFTAPFNAATHTAPFVLLGPATEGAADFDPIDFAPADFETT